MSVATLKDPLELWRAKLRACNGPSLMNFMLVVGGADLPCGHLSMDG
jgi:hypothetical protein